MSWASLFTFSLVTTQGYLMIWFCLISFWSLTVIVPFFKPKGGSSGLSRGSSEDTSQCGLRELLHFMEKWDARGSSVSRRFPTWTPGLSEVRKNESTGYITRYKTLHVLINKILAVALSKCFSFCIHVY